MGEKLFKYAKDIGFDDVYLLPYMPLSKSAEEGAALLPKAKSVLLLLKKHNLYTDFPDSSMSVHSHYPAYQQAYNLCKNLVEALNNDGYNVRIANNLSLKSYAVTAGLSRLKNTLIYHDVFGTYFIMQAITTDCSPLFYQQNTIDICKSCNKCVEACPTSAISNNGFFDKDRCIRSHVPVKESIPEDLRMISGKSYIGCGICQSVCPLNSEIKKVPPPAELVECLDIENMLNIAENITVLENLGKLIGSNEARPARTIATACLAAGNSGKKEYLGSLKTILSSYIHPLPRIYAAYAIGKIGCKDDFLHSILEKENDLDVIAEIIMALFINPDV